MPKDDGEEAGEGERPGEGGEGVVLQNPIGEYYGQRNDKNERHGRGRAKLPNGDIYLGCYYKGKRHGLGIYRYKNGNGARYGGDWVLGEKQGWGTFYYPDGSQYTGNWYRGLRHGWGVYVYPNGDEYEGWWYHGYRNGRGIYRTKATGEKFVGNWTLGWKQGPGMIIRKHHRFIGNWYNDVPRGPGVYVFPDLGVEQHGKYTHLKALPETLDKWRNSGYQVRNIRSATPPADPVLVEKDKRLQLMIQFGLYGGMGDMEMDGEEFEGEGRYSIYKRRPQSMLGEFDDPYGGLIPEGDEEDYEQLELAKKMSEPSNPYKGDFCLNKDKVAGPICSPPKQVDPCEEEGEADIPLPEPKDPLKEIEDLLFEHMKKVIAEETEPDNIRIPVVPMWRAIQITPIMTPLPDETVPPPPMPPTPLPPPEPEPDEEQDKAEAKKIAEDEDPITRAKRLAMTHKLEDPFMGSGVCQRNAVSIKIPPAEELAGNYSSLSLSNMDEFRLQIESTVQQLPPYDLDEARRTSNAPTVLSTSGMDAVAKWGSNLAQDPDCDLPDPKMCMPPDSTQLDQDVSAPFPSENEYEENTDATEFATDEENDEA
ncbi:unnamed protein product [Allacma fusca]|uniref:Radial spoke head 1 homolog n=1 Tax=Allacma fusca TaxID=39272 RepID=A0A8J2L2B5_9HEXA|nr:unnamed protein product [Allacma fusca]